MTAYKDGAHHPRRTGGDNVRACSGLCGAEAETERWFLLLAAAHPDWPFPRVRQRAAVMAVLAPRISWRG